MRTRFAPSTTGFLHIGHVLHLKYVWGLARKFNGEVLCRIENHDRERDCPEFERSILEDMDWLGFMPDLGLCITNHPHPSPFRQSDCAEYYEEMLKILIAKDLVYGCCCSRREILDQNKGGKGELCYQGTCANKNLPLEGHTVRFRTPPTEVLFDDENAGPQKQTPKSQCGDFSLRDRKGQWTYQFCCVCDDIRQEIDWVIRGEDLLQSTGRQIQLFQAFDSPPPRYFHHRLLCDADGNKWSKRQHASSISQQRALNVPAKTVLNRAGSAL